MGAEEYCNEDDCDSAVDGDDDGTDGGVITGTMLFWSVQVDDEVGNEADVCCSAWRGDGGQVLTTVVEGRCTSGSITAIVAGGGGGGGVCEREDDGEGDRLSGCN